MPDSVPVTLSEVRDGQPVELARETVRLDPEGKPVKVRFVHQPKEAGEKTFVVQVPVQPDEAEPGNNRLEHRVFVAEARRLRVLLVEGYPRWDCRYIKSLFERESEAVRGNKSIDVDSYLVGASPDHPKQDRTSINRFPTPEELRKYDVVILGDVDPRQLPRADECLESLGQVRQGPRRRAARCWPASTPTRTPTGTRLWPTSCRSFATARRRPRRTHSRRAFRPRAHPGRSESPVVPVQHRGGRERRDLEPPAAPLLVRPRLPAKAARPKCWPSTRTGRPRGRPGHGRRRTTRSSFNNLSGPGGSCSSGSTTPGAGGSESPRCDSTSSGSRPCRRWPAGGSAGRRSAPIARPTAATTRFEVRSGSPDDAPPPEGPVRVTVERQPPKQPGGGPRSRRTANGPTRPPRRGAGDVRGPHHPDAGGGLCLHPSDARRPGSPPRAEARVLPPPGELDRIQLNEPDMQRAARESRGAVLPARTGPTRCPTNCRRAAGRPGPAVRAVLHLEQPGRCSPWCCDC